MLWTIIGWIVFGLIAGFIARALVPGRDDIGLLRTILLGVAGSVVGGLIFGVLTVGLRGFHPAGLIGSVIGGFSLNPDGTRLATVAAKGAGIHGVKLWDTRTGLEVFTFDPQTEFAFVAFSPDGHRLAAVTAIHEDASGNPAAELRIWDGSPIRD